MIELREYQRETVEKAKIILKEKNCVYIAAEVRTGKSPISITVAKEMGWRKVCIITKKNAISGIAKFTAMEPSIRWTLTNYEQAHKLFNDFDGFIIDEAHSLGAFAPPSKRARVCKELIGIKPVIFLSGTPNPESKSQLFHQFWVCKYGPFRHYATFYKFAKDYVNVKQKWVNGWQINDYSHTVDDKIDAAVKPYMVTLSQVDAGFSSLVEEEILYVNIDERLYDLMNLLKKKKVYTTKSGKTIICDTPVKMQSVFHQLSSGTIKINEDREVFDESKAWFIKTKFAGQKIAVFYKFIEEGNVLRRLFPNNTDDPEFFNKKSDITYIKQMVSGREGSNLSTADALVMYNIDFSATTYWQVRARMQELERTKASKLYWIFSRRGLEQYVYKAVVEKMDYNTSYFKKDVKLIGTEQLMLI